MTPATRSAEVVPATEAFIRNPVLPGFHPDLSILRVGADYYIATSTFEWYPGVRLHHSTDLTNWRPLGGILTERRLLDLTGAEDSAGVWAPDLSFVDGVYHLVYTDVASFSSGYWDSQNYVVSATDPRGPWSDPVALHARGFDPSLFHDTDGTSWLLSMNSDWRTGRERFAGIHVQRYDRETSTLIGHERLIFSGASVGMTEAPHLYRRDGWYYLITAEGGTSWPHQITVARSRELFGPYEVAPGGPMLSSAGRPELALQKAGHGCLVSTPDGQWYLAHLVARPYSRSARASSAGRRPSSGSPWTRPAGRESTTPCPSRSCRRRTVPRSSRMPPTPPNTTTSTRPSSARTGPPCADRPHRTGHSSPPGRRTCGSTVDSPRSGASARAWWPAA